MSSPYRPPSQRGITVVPPELITRVREAFGMIQGAFAGALGISASSLFRLEKNGGNEFERLALIGLLEERHKLIPTLARLELRAELHTCQPIAERLEMQHAG